MGKGAPFCLNGGHLALHIRALIATAEPGNCPRESFFLPLRLMRHSYIENKESGQRGTFMPYIMDCHLFVYVRVCGSACVCTVIPR